MKKSCRSTPILITSASCLLAFLSASASAATYFWDGNDTTANADGGAGTWNTAATNWDTLLFGGANASWSNANPDSAIFAGTAGTATLGENITTGGISFSTTGYTIDTGANTLSFGASAIDTPILFRSVAAATITGTVAGSGNVSISRGNGSTTGTLTFAGTSAGGWSGTTTVNSGMFVLVNAAGVGTNAALLNTSGITLNGGMITQNYGAAAANLINDTAPITANGGTLSLAVPANNGTINYAETVGAVALTSGQTTFLFNQTQVSGSGSHTLTFGSGLTSGLSRTGSTNTSSVVFASSGVVNATKNIMVVNAAGGATPAGQIIGPWAYVGNTVSHTDYAVYDASNRVVPANIAASAENTWTTPANAYTMTSSQVLSGTRTITALKSNGATLQVTVDTNKNLETYGLINVAANTVFTVAPVAASNGALTTPSGGGQLHVNAGISGSGNQGPITITAPIIDNGGAVILVKNGNGTLTLGQGGIASNYSGGTVINAGIISTGSSTSSTAMLGSGGITFNGTTYTAAGVPITSGLTTSWNGVSTAIPLTINNGALATLSFNGKNTFTSAVTGTGGLAIQGTYNDLTLSSTGNTFTGPIVIGPTATEGANGYRLTVNSLADSTIYGTGNITFGWNRGSGSGQGTKFILAGSGTNLSLTNRQFELTGGAPTSGSINAAIRNDTTGSSSFAIASDLLVTATAARTLSLAGTNASAINTFSGRIADGASSVVSIFKGDAVASSPAATDVSTWILSGNNTYTGTTTVTTGTLEIQGSIASSSSITNNAALVFNSGSAQSYGNVISGGGTLTKTGTGTLTLSNAANSYGGATAVNNGTLLVSGSITGSGAVSVAAAGTLAGNGALAGATTVANGGKLSPGLTSAVGTLNFGGNLNISAVNTAGSFVFQLGAVGPTNSDIVDLTSVTGVLTIGTGVGLNEFAFTTVGGFGAGTYTLFETESPISGSLDAADLVGTVGGLPATLGLSGDNTDIILTVVPEPSSVALLGLGIFGLMRRRRRE